MNNYTEYVGLYKNVEKVYECDDFIYYKWYDKAFIVSLVPSEYYKMNPIGSLFTKMTYKSYCCAVIELIPEFANAIDFVNNEDTSKHIVNNYIVASNKKSCAFIAGNEYNAIDDEYDDYLRNVTFHFHMKYLKFRDGNTDMKFYNIRFFKLENDLVELMEVD